MSRLQEIVRRFPVRKNADQKSEFLKYALAAGRQMGYSVKVEEDGRHRNFVAGDPDAAAVLFTAHYDTPANMVLPNLILPRNLPLFYGYQLLVVALLFLISAGAAFAAYLLGAGGPLLWVVFLVVYYALLLLMMMGPANQHNVNDNTSGVAAVLALMEALPEEARGCAAFLLFDDEEKGRQGSKAFAVRHPEIKKRTLVINMDCVGVGDHLLLIAKNYARVSPLYPLLQESFSADGDYTPHFYGTSGSVYNSDQQSFRCGVGAVMCKRRRFVGFYTPWIHTRRDTEASEENISYLVQSLSKFVKSVTEI